MRKLIGALQATFSLFFSTKEPAPYNKVLLAYVHEQLGNKPKRLDLYVQAMTHRSYEQERSHHFASINERLEYLGDAVLDLCVADLLFKAYPTAEEGVLTNMRSNIVNTAHLAYLAEQIQLTKLLRYRGEKPSTNVIGDALEAFIGAVYLDQGYTLCFQFIQRRLIAAHVSLKEMRTRTFNHKGKVVEWAQQKKKNLHFETLHLQHATADKKYQTILYIEDQELAQAIAGSKKEAQQLAAQAACIQLNITETCL